MQFGRAANVYYVLFRESKAWERLHREGFQLLDWGSDEHIAAQLSAAVFASSHADHPILWPVPQWQVEELAEYEFVFLQHGVIKNDLSQWLNPKPIRLFVTSTPEEATSIRGDDSPYRFTDREVILTGLPRHDALLRRAESVKPDCLVLMPTWRKHLTDETARSGLQERAPTSNFSSSEWATHWGRLMSSHSLRDTAEAHGLRIIWAPHPNMAMYNDDMPVPEWVTTVDVRTADYQALLASAALAITDFSSVAFDVAYLDRPIVYFQFDGDHLDTMGHTWRPGYFSYANNGFGPVCDSVNEVVASVDAALSGQEDPAYPRRRLETFPFKDGKCSERVAAEIFRLLDV